MPDTDPILIPDALQPADGRFGSGPSKVRREQVDALRRGRDDVPRHVAPPGDRARAGRPAAGRARRAVLAARTATRSCCPTAARRRSGTRPRSAWCASAASTSRSASSASKFAAAVAAAPFLGAPTVDRSPSRATRRSSRPRPASTCTPARTTRRRPASPSRSAGSPAPTTARSCCGTRRRRPAGCPSTSTESDVYYFAPQKSFGSDGGLWVALMSPAALARIDEITACGRWVPPFLDLVDRGRAVAPRPDVQHPGARDDLPDGRAGRLVPRPAAASTGASSGPPSRPRSCTAGPRRARYATPYVIDPAKRSQVVGTIDLVDSRRRDRGREGAARQRDRRHRAVPQARAQPAAGGDVPGDRAGGRAGADRLHRPRRRARCSRADDVTALQRDRPTWMVVLAAVDLRLLPVRLRTQRPAAARRARRLPRGRRPARARRCPSARSPAGWSVSASCAAIGRRGSLWTGTGLLCVGVVGLCSVRVPRRHAGVGGTVRLRRHPHPERRQRDADGPAPHRPAPRRSPRRTPAPGWPASSRRWSSAAPWRSGLGWRAGLLVTLLLAGVAAAGVPRRAGAGGRRRRPGGPPRRACGRCRGSSG